MNTMRCTALIAVLALVPFSPANVIAQDAGGSIATGKTIAKKTPEISEFEEAIETIATSTDRDAVNSADAKLRTGGLPAIRTLVQHLTDSRRPPSNYLTRAVSGEVDMGDHSFWLIQDMLESHTSKLDASYSPLEKKSIAKWLAGREGMSLAQLRREACIGAFAKILAMEKKYPNFDARPVIMSYAERLVELDNAIHKDE
ncbi:hypothetical protein SH528x_002997 [Novipirellula sp. SH528]|uniref:hypothetical protein n=1 Tax=Novipirellula sp. SH528 TaxID=3454466 RepID=UPI003FA11D20